MKKIFFRAFSGYLFITIILSFGIYFFSYQLVKSSYIKEIEDHIEDIAISLIPSVRNFYENREFKALDKFVKKIGKEVNLRITVIDTYGEVIADSEKDPEFMENHRGRPEVKKALLGVKGISIRYSETVKEDMLYVAIPLYKEGKIQSVLRVSIFLKNIKEILADMRDKILTGIIIILLFSWIIASLFSKDISKSLKDILHAFKKFSEGDFSIRVLPKRKDEFGELAEKFNEMADEIKLLFEELNKERKVLNSIFSYAPDGILILDQKGKVVLFNNKLKEILMDKIEKNMFYWEIIKSSDFINFVKNISERNPFFSKEILLEGRIFLCSGGVIEPTNQMIFLFHDITEMKRVEEVKKDFTINISHELRTPLTAIKGFIETIEEEENIKNKKFLEIIKNHINRLIKITERMLYLSKIEGKEIISREKIEIKEIVERTFYLFKKEIEKKNLRYEIDIQEDLPSFKADPYEIEQVFINLIENAVKYTEKGKIKVSASKKDNFLRIEVEDTGIGIPEEHLPRIFERFYVVDKSRARKKGGVGLGLAIVKHIVLSYNGNIYVRSEKGKGTRFIIDFPI